MWLQERKWHAELLDDPGLDTPEVYRALDGLRRLNFISRSAGTLWAEMKKLARARQLRHLRVLDIACGGGDVAIALMRRAKKSGIALVVEACDLNPRSLEYARQKAGQAGHTIKFFVRDVLDEPLPGDYDIVVCSLFLHHLQEHEAIKLLRHLAGAARYLVLLNDLQRSMVNCAMVWLGSRLLSRSHVVHRDAMLSMKNAFTRAELAALAERAGLREFSITALLPARMMLRWEKS
jgi:2-polyprenyl-3-methyl-5-hydroxy-6-metoxy-1,4-benzoquinol methylase